MKRNWDDIVVLNFSNENYKRNALSLSLIIDDVHSPFDAFFLLINGISIDDLSNLCYLIKENSDLFNFDGRRLTDDECYSLTQNLEASREVKQLIMNLAGMCLNGYETVDGEKISGKHLGNKTINEGKINTSAWLSHSFYVGEVCSVLAKELGLDYEKAKTLGLLHDFGRKFNHGFDHVIKGFEALVALGWKSEAISCLTHSFVNGGRCSNNEVAVEGFYVDENGDARWKPDVVKDDVTIFLEKYQFTDYDMILNMADLMATDRGIVSPFDRINDISKRRKNLDEESNRGYFFNDMTNMFVEYLEKIHYIDFQVQPTKKSFNHSLDQIKNKFHTVSDCFFDVYSVISHESQNSSKKNM